MALWPFGKKNKNEGSSSNSTANSPRANVPGNSDVHTPGEHVENVYQDESSTAPAVGDTAADARAASSEPVAVALPHDAVNGESGPFDGDSVAIETFDFSDFSNGILDLGSLKIPLPKESQVQVEMGSQGPKMLHIITRYGRITPVAFAAPRIGGQWVSSVAELTANINKDGMPTHLEDGPWGSEIVAHNPNGMIRIIGVEGPRWLLRLTLAAPAGKEEGLVKLGREVVARTFVYRGEDPILAGNSLPVTMPAQLVQQVQEEMKRRAQEQSQPTDNTVPASGTDSSAQAAETAQKPTMSQAEAARRIYEMLGGNPDKLPASSTEEESTPAPSADKDAEKSEPNGEK